MIKSVIKIPPSVVDWYGVRQESEEMSVAVLQQLRIAMKRDETQSMPHWSGPEKVALVSRIVEGSTMSHTITQKPSETIVAHQEGHADCPMPLNRRCEWFQGVGPPSSPGMERKLKGRAFRGSRNNCEPGSRKVAKQSKPSPFGTKWTACGHQGRYVITAMRCDLIEWLVDDARGRVKHGEDVEAATKPCWELLVDLSRNRGATDEKSKSSLGQCNRCDSRINGRGVIGGPWAIASEG
ncbi:hypothetical protein FA15DRAFT_653300 [Coprinopsis marcescibilis]|uniref:Uncharacterized protein n=1 Tax=Coprinopsis marcescibilis TaxID=230819 RepID=A0A5C3LGZ1_COPMA|nr:hypothetical protein FA15DRAFT_653300 [Coprinopsis marcescibilis]